MERRTASDRAKRKSLIKANAAPCAERFCIIVLKLGNANADRIATIVTTTNISISVNPCEWFFISWSLPFSTNNNNAFPTLGNN